MREQIFFKPLFLVVSGLVIWAAHFTVVYAVNSFACERGLAAQKILGMDLVPFVISVATLLAASALVVVAAFGFMGRTPTLPEASQDRVAFFFRKLTITIASLSLLAVIYVAIPAFIVPACV